MALERGPEEVRCWRSWLGVVARRLAASQARAARRREQRERTVARLVEVPSTEDMLDRLSIQECIARAVIALPEPQRTAILLRFYEEMRPAEMAARLHVPLSTISSRIQRGLHLLRTSLKEERTNQKDWRKALAVIAAKPLASGALGLSHGTTNPLSILCMATAMMNIKALLGGLLVALVLVTGFMFRSELGLVAANLDSHAESDIELLTSEDGKPEDQARVAGGARRDALTETRDEQPEEGPSSSGKRAGAGVRR